MVAVHYIPFMCHKFLVLTVKELLKSVYIYPSYRKIKTGLSLFWTTRYVCTLTLHEVPQLVSQPCRCWWLWPASHSLMPAPTDWRQQSKRSMFNTSELGSDVWKSFISSGMYVVISLIVSEIQHQKGPHQHHLQQLKWQVIHLVQQQYHNIYLHRCR